jgi:alkylated DNA repair dioxygenase AlkB
MINNPGLFPFLEDQVNIPGLKLIEDFITPHKAEELLKIVDSQPWLNDLQRRVQHYGYKYDYKLRDLENLYLGSLPNWLLEICKALTDTKIFDHAPGQVIINEYLPGQGISPHIDCVPCFGETIASLSLGSSCIMDFQKLDKKVSVMLEPNSLCVMKDEARYNWQHSIPSRKTDFFGGVKITRGRRVSLTFRNVI